MLRLKLFFGLLFVIGVFGLSPTFAWPTSAPMGVVTGAQRAMVGQIAAVDGTSLYDGDTVATETTGSMRLRFGGSQMVLSGDSAVTLNRTEAGVNATLLRGTVRFSSLPGSILDLSTLKVVTVRTKGDKPVIGQLTVVSPTVFEVGSSKGDLVVAVNGNEHDVAEATAYRVDISDPAPRSGSNGTQAAGKSKGLWLAIAAIAGGTAAAIVVAFLSPSKP